MEPIERIIKAAAQSPSMKNDGSWGFLEMYLDLHGVDTSQRSPSEWMETYQIYREIIEETKIQESRNPKGRCYSPEWEKRCDSGSFVDSAIDIEDKEHKADNYISVLVKKTTECPDGVEAVLVLYSELEEESYILQTICEQLGLRPGRDGKVRVKYYLKDSMKSSIEKCSIRLDKDGEADLVFARKQTKAVEDAKDGEATSDQTSKVRGRRSSSLQNPLDDLPEEDEEQEEDDDVDIDAVSNAIGKAFQPRAERAQRDEEKKDLGRDIKLAIRGAKKR